MTFWYWGFGVKPEFGGRIIARALKRNGQVDPLLSDNIKFASENEFNLGLYLTPCFTCGRPEVQIERVCNAIKVFGDESRYRVYVNIDEPDTWSSDQSANIRFLESFVNAIMASDQCFYEYSIMTTKFDWETIFSESYSEQSKKYLVYESHSCSDDFSDFKPFGGWTNPRAKYENSECLAKCGRKKYIWAPSWFEETF